MFISHTSELRDFPAGKSYVAAVERAISATGHVVVDMADFAAADQAPARVCAERVRGCDVYVGVLGTRYGSPVRDRLGVSYTELEFDTATEAGLDRLVFVLNTEAEELGIPASALIDREFGARQDAFLRRVQDSGLTMQSFASPAGLGQLVERSLRDLADTRQRRERVQAEDVPTARESWAPEAGRGIARWTGECPYRGLLPFGESDAEVFYGRERLAAELAVKMAVRVSRGGMIVVTGASGSGKSSLLRAGLLPILARGPADTEIGPVAAHRHDADQGPAHRTGRPAGSSRRPGRSGGPGRADPAPRPGAPGHPVGGARPLPAMMSGRRPVAAVRGWC